VEVVAEKGAGLLEAGALEEVDLVAEMAERRNLAGRIPKDRTA
jgi:hypothetical protein